MILLYDFLLLVLFIPAVVGVALTQRRRFVQEFLAHLGERFGRWNLSLPYDPSTPLVWVHCASLGEVRAVEPLLKSLGGVSILLTTVTLSGRQYALANKLADHVRYIPLDFNFLVRRAISGIKPAVLVILETELWPGLIHAASSAGTPIVLINARMSAHSYPFYRSFRMFWKPFISRISVIAARSLEDAERYCTIGAAHENVRFTGNIKYDRVFPRPSETRQDFNFNGRDLLWVCGSTRPGEEELLAAAFASLRKSFPHLKLLIAPRHLQRVGRIRTLLSSRGITAVLRSEKAPASDCLIIDTFGELQKFYALADITFVGGSLVPKGGQNPIEPAAYGRPVLYGTHMDNFVSEAAALDAAGGGFRVKDTTGLIETAARLLADPGLRSAAGLKAAAAVEAQKGALNRTAEIIRSVIGQRLLP